LTLYDISIRSNTNKQKTRVDTCSMIQQRIRK
jgi:hypothetical protein